MPHDKALLALAERVEGASGAERELDCEVARLAKLSQAQPDGTWMTYFDGGYQHSIDPPCVTASLDAAMGLVPEGAHCGMGRDAAHGNQSLRSWAWVRFKAGADWKEIPTVWARGDIPLALTAACLRALATSEAE